MHIKENQPLAPYTTFGIGGPARWFVEATTEDEIAESVEWARQKGAQLFVLGGGSNLLVSDHGFDGLVVHIGLRGIAASQSADHPGHRLYECAAGEIWDEFVERAAQENSAGIECMAGIPGTVGGTPVQNVGAYGQEVASTITLVRAFDREGRAFVEFSAAECAFAYRRSRFNSTDNGRYIVTRVDYLLSVNGAPTLRYADLQRIFENGESSPTLIEVTAAVRRIRQSKAMLIVPGDPDSRSAGSFFKNPVVSEAHALEIAASSAKTLPRYPAGSGSENAGKVKLPAAWLIEQAGFAKGYVKGEAAISSRHTLALVNRGEATAMDVLDLASEISSAVERRFGIQLEMEPVFVGRRG
ncbi:MAG: UDP-N-acetylmuramate dehydrogenase [Terracidiphilus sp.]